MFGDHVFGLDAGAGDKTIAVRVGVRCADVRETPGRQLRLGFKAARDSAGLIHVAAETTKAEWVDGEAAKRDRSLQTRIDVGRAKQRAVIGQPLIESGVDADRLFGA